MNSFRASEAYTQSNGANKRSADGRTADDINYTLTINRLFETIRQESKNGKKRLAFISPQFVLDGCLAEPVLLAKQIKTTLITMGYAVERDDETLYISWDKKDTQKREKPISIVRNNKEGSEVRRAIKLPRTEGPPRGFAQTVAPLPPATTTTVTRSAPATTTVTRVRKVSAAAKKKK